MGKLEDKKLKSKYSFEEVSKILKIDKADAKEFEDEGVFEFKDKEKAAIDQQNFERLKTAVSLKREMGVNTAGIDIILNMKDKMSYLQGEFNDLITNVRTRLGDELESDLAEIEKNLKK